jgi:hypothetical protein
MSGSRRRTAGSTTAMKGDKRVCVWPQSLRFQTAGQDRKVQWQRQAAAASRIDMRCSFRLHVLLPPPSDETHGLAAGIFTASVPSFCVRAQGDGETPGP